MIKRLADFCNNLAVASFAIGLYKGIEPIAVLGGIISLTGALVLTRLGEKP